MSRTLRALCAFALAAAALGAVASGETSWSGTSPDTVATAQAASVPTGQVAGIPPEPSWGASAPAKVAGDLGEPSWGVVPPTSTEA